jgi:hypothetical protein
VTTSRSRIEGIVALEDIPFGKVLISVTAAGTMAAPYIFDGNASHILNPKWMAHA